MPRVRLATERQIDVFTDQKIRRLTEEGYINESERTRAEMLLSDFADFSDKAFKAFYARKILQLPPVIAAQVFDVSNGLISQAATDRNVYTARNAEGMDDDLQRGLFMIPNVQGRHGFMLSRQAKANIFRNMAHIAIFKNRGVDVPNFQNRMVASYMSEAAADELRESMQQFAAQVQSQFATPQTPTREELQRFTSQVQSGGMSEGLPYSRTNTVELTQVQRNDAILSLIAAGSDRDQAQRLIRELTDLGFNFTVRSRSGNELSYRLHYFGSMSDAVSSADVLATIIGGLNLGATDVSMGTRQDDLVGTIVFPSQAASAQGDANRTIFINDRERTATNTWFDNNGYADTREDFYQAIRQANLEIVLESRATANIRFFVRKTGTSVGLDIIGEARRLKGILAGPDRTEYRQRQRYRLINYSRVTNNEVSFNVSRFDEDAPGLQATTSAPQEARSTTELITVQSLRPNQREVIRYDDDSSGAEETLQRFQEMGYTPAEARRVMNFLYQKNLSIFKINPNVQGGNNVTTYAGRSVPTTPYRIMEVQAIDNDNPRRFRTSTWVNFLRSNVLMGVFPDARQNTQAGRRQRATFRRGVGGANIGYLHLPDLTRLDAINAAPATQTSQATATAQTGSQTQADRSPTQGIRFVGYQYADAGRLFRSGSLRFIRNSQVLEAGRKSYMLYWWSDVAQMFYQLPAGQMDLMRGSIIPIYDTLNMISQSTPGKLKLYRNARMQALVASSIRSTGDEPSFTPERIGGEPSLQLNVADYRFFTDAYGNEGTRAQTIRQLANTVSVDVAGTGQATASTVTDAQASQVSQMPFTNTLGFEFEGGGMQTRQQTAATLTRLGVPCNFEGYNHTTRAQWKIVTDATLSGVPNGMELVSPILTGEEGLKDLGKCLRATQEAGMFIHEQGGVHIHMGNQQWDLQHRKNILLNQVKVQKFFLKTIPQYREDMGRQWARPFDTNRRFTDRIRNANDIQTLARVTGTRYMLINITNTRQPTWEWRYPTGSLEVDTNVYSARLIDKLVQVSKFGELPSSMTSGEGMKKWMGQDIFSFWKNRIYELSQTKGSTRRPSSN